jgi:hypothetical protein
MFAQMSKVLSEWASTLVTICRDSSHEVGEVWRAECEEIHCAQPNELLL